MTAVTATPLVPLLAQQLKVGGALPFGVRDEFGQLLLARGPYPAIASHDENIIGEALRHIEDQKLDHERFEFQMLYGIRRDLQRKLVSQGFRLRLYVPYGDAWYPYFMRRLAERPANVIFLAKNLVRS